MTRFFSSGAVFAAGQTIRIYGTGEGRGELTFAGIRQEVLCREGRQLVQQAQYDIQFTVPHVTTVISADVSARDRIHPPKKYALSQRIARALRA